ncbi:Phosphatidylethanolamine N-methyltransferase [Thioalkalivibrio nitratireducens DSM 14787]|uniref:Phosphatidylethanolamine N-methyltransferase n=1 Tax=Thioalkalivibrio nitratireducens (strain DSM 14787 / UNIQEM 213 / ALEN2) TaxID=1255043 RepID=L0E0H0_THIND|nr:class I SAM-dependent methyltransferase [Thioalkalivibrio nitratireducens]AGA34742.1 Phosphatidylethanolamine N-methyltransferase [Thioalkalivibrio nitratireducens DSM 14787]
MDLISIRKSYRRYARHYDVIFGRVFARGRRLALDTLAPVSGKRVLEVGVGTGISLPFYCTDAEVVGIDISREMLEVARRRVSDQGCPAVIGLAEMNAERLGFADDSFDAVVAMYVASVVPNPEQLFAEMWRVCRPGGQILVVNHFASRQWFLRTLERSLRPLSRAVGFRPDMELDHFVAVTGREPVAIEPASLFGYWKQVQFTKSA